MELKHTQTITYHVNSDDVESFIEKIYGRKYDIKKFENCEVDDVIEKEPDMGEEIADYDLEDLENFKNPTIKDWQNRVEGYFLYVLFQDMCNRGLIESGYYIMRVV